jgi:DNA-binding transcriptional MerR regulator
MRAITHRISSMEMRVEALAEGGGVSVDTVRYYQAKGLLHPPRRQGRVAWYDDSHLARLTRIRALQAKGFPLAAIARVLSGELDAADEALVGALATRVLPDPEALLTKEELADRTGIPEPLLSAVEREGLLLPHRVGDRVGYTDDDVAAARAGLTLLQWGVPLPELLALARAHHDATDQVARGAVELFDQYVRKPARTADTGADAGTTERLVEAFAAVLPAATTLVTYHFTRVLLQVAMDHIEQVGDHEELRAVRSAAGS